MLTVVELVCVLAVVAAFIWLLKDADLYVGDASAVWFAPVAIALYGARKTGTLERRLVQAEATLETMLQPTLLQTSSATAATQGSPAMAAQGSLAAIESPRQAERGLRRSRFPTARLAWIGFVALTVALATIGFQASGAGSDDGDSEEDGAVVSGQRL